MSGLQDAIVGAILAVLELLFLPIEELIEAMAPRLLAIIVGTPFPNKVFEPPTNGPWPGLYEYYWDGIVPISLSLFGLSLGIVIFLETTSHLFGGYHKTRLKKRAFVGLLGILSWWWMAALSLRLTAVLAGVILPDLSEISLFQTLSFSALGVLGLVLTLSVDLVLFGVLAVIYLIRQFMLYMFVLLMPILIVFWIPGIGPFELVSRFMKQLAGLYVPFLFMTVPVAVLFRLGAILGESVSFSPEGAGAWLTALVMPVMAVISPLVMVWQAGSLFPMLDRAGHGVSRKRAVDRGQKYGKKGHDAGKKVYKRGRGVKDTGPETATTVKTNLESRLGRFSGSFHSFLGQNDDPAGDADSVALVLHPMEQSKQTKSSDGDGDDEPASRESATSGGTPQTDSGEPRSGGFRFPGPEDWETVGARTQWSPDSSSQNESRSDDVDGDSGEVE